MRLRIAIQPAAVLLEHPAQRSLRYRLHCKKRSSVLMSKEKKMEIHVFDQFNYETSKNKAKVIHEKKYEVL